MRTICLILLSFYFCTAASPQTVLQGGVTTVRLGAHTGLSSQQALYGQLNSQSNFSLSARKTSEPAALGISWHNENGEIYYIDVISDLYGKISIGDRIVAINGIPVMQAMRQRVNFGPAGTMVQVSILSQDGIICLECERRSISQFSIGFQRTLRF